MSENLYQTWGDESGKKSALDSTDLDGYDGVVHKGIAHNDFSNRQTYIDIEPNRSVRPSFNRTDYDAFRPGEAVPTRQKRIIGACMEAYDRVGIIRNVIDLMSDFSSQGLALVHPNKNIEKFYRKWFSQIKGYDRSERFLNYLYRCGNVVVQRRTAKLSKKNEQNLKRAAGADIVIENQRVPSREIPWMYDFYNPCAIEIKDSGLWAIGKPEFYLNLSEGTRQSLLTSSNDNKGAFSGLSLDIQKRLKKGDRKLPLSDSTFFYHYKKDDWHLWANPMIYAILDDIKMLEKMKLADLAALDGTISQVRLWTVGDYDHKIVPTRAGLQKVRDILASNVGGGTMDLVWGPELKFTESNSQAYKFLGSEKYQPILTSIYAGLGIPPTLTGASGSSGGYSNNYVSLKTLVERLEYGREVLTTFWRQEIEFVRRAMGFKLPAEIHFDSIILSDESAQKKLLMDLSDRGVLSDETLLERFREIPNIEKVRVKREEKNRSSDINSPKKAGPYHNPQHKEDMAKIAITKDVLNSEDYLNNIGLPYEEPKIEESQPSNKITEEKKSVVDDGGRPKFSKDKITRKQKRVLPRSGDASLFALSTWCIHAQEKISEVMTPIACEHYKRSDARSLSKTQIDELEYLKLCIFTGMEPMMEITNEVIQDIIKLNTKPTQAFISMASERVEEFISIRKRKPNPSEIRSINASTYVEILNGFSL